HAELGDKVALIDRRFQELLAAYGMDVQIGATISLGDSGVVILEIEGGGGVGTHGIQPLCGIVVVGSRVTPVRRQAIRLAEASVPLRFSFGNTPIRSPNRK